MEILDSLRSGNSLTPAQLDAIIRKHSKRAGDGRRVYAKKHVLAYYLDVQRNDANRFASWDVPAQLDEAFLATMQMKPRRTASGVATITVITKPWRCSSNCIYCPCDIRMPKSYLHDEPACQRAERNFFDPYLQVSSRLAALQNMGHATDKVELIVLGGSWTDYPAEYRTWYVTELFRALNDDDDTRKAETEARFARYCALGLADDAATLQKECSALQAQVNAGNLTYNDAIAQLQGPYTPRGRASSFQEGFEDELNRQHALNENAGHRVVGLVFETRPEAVSADALRHMRQLGCTKVQIGIQSLSDDMLRKNGRAASCDDAANAFALCRLFGFKVHTHLMLNLLGQSPESDKREYRTLMTDGKYLPDEVKLYPCALVAGTALSRLYEKGQWAPYTEDELIDALCADLEATPPFVRVSRMIRDISAKDIMVGNKKTNLRQLVENELAKRNASVQEIRYREIGTASASLDELRLAEHPYETASTHEVFLQWVDSEERIYGFLRLSLPKQEAVRKLAGAAPIGEGQAMIREVHVYGFAAKISSEGNSAQHHGLGKALVNRACEIAREHGYADINVISAVGTREYYRKLGFADAGLYQRMKL